MESIEIRALDEICELSKMDGTCFLICVSLACLWPLRGYVSTSKSVVKPESANENL